MSNYRALTQAEIKQLESQECCSADWSKVQVADPFQAGRIREVCFGGDVRLGDLTGTVKTGQAVKGCGIYEAALTDVTLGDGCLIRNVGSHIAGYDIGNNVVIEDVGLLECQAGSSFGCGVEVDALNEAGGRGVKLYPELSSQVASLLAVYRHRPKLIAALNTMIDQRISEVKSSRGCIGDGVLIRGAALIRNVNIGSWARIEGPAELNQGTILSEECAPALVGSGVMAKEFVFAEGSSVTGGAVLEHCFVGQGSKVGKQFSAENCLFFCNCEAFHGEAVALLAGPYTVTHHKSTLLIAADMSFFNAGSGTNQSNHMYKLGPVHQGTLERGSKTGSFSYLLWPCRVGPFCVVIGKNMANFDVGDLPFSYIDANGSKSFVTPAFNLFTVGTVRDAAKWPARDRRTASNKRDLINFPAFSPYTVGRMLNGEALLSKLSKETPKSVSEVNINGAWVKRLLLRNGAKFYRIGIDAYLAGKILDRAESSLDDGLAAVQKALQPNSKASDCRQWTDISGLLLNLDRFESLLSRIEGGQVGDLNSLTAELAQCHQAYQADEWNWVASVWEERFGVKPSEMSPEQLSEVGEKLKVNRGKYLRMVLSDANKEFGEIPRIGFGAGGSVAERDADFEQVRGTFDDNKFVVEMQAELTTLEDRCASFIEKAAKLA
jgi:Domain of unknown function (DUF4954)/Domain of unknown function (DUF6819)